MKFKLSLIYTALFAGVSVSFVANVNAKEHSTNEHTLEGIEVITKLVNEKGYKAERTEITGVNSSIIDTPYSIDIVTQEQLQDKQPSTLEDAVKGISGLSQGNNLAGTLDTVKRRGYGGNRDGSIMRNGLASPLARNFNANVERVEVLKGPASVLYGMQNPGGVINVVTKKPVSY
ncbi:TonB-dependent siderophore receptor, partial [Haemophilus haemolyticus]